MVKKSQFAIEYMMIAAFVILGLTIMIFTVYSNLGEQNRELEIAQLQKFGNTIIEVTNRLSYMGDESRSTITAILPANINSIYIENDKYLIIEYIDQNNIVPITFRSKQNLALDFENFAPGVKNLMISTKEDYVVVCDKTTIGSCDNICKVSEGEDAYNNANDCCKPDCSECQDDGRFFLCSSDNLCHASCDNHNTCNAQCDWNASWWNNDVCYNCTATCLWGNTKTCPKNCVNATGFFCGNSVTLHTLGEDEFCNYGMQCNASNCVYLSSTALDAYYCYSCTQSGSALGEYCPPAGRYFNDICYYGEWNCTAPNDMNCTLFEMNMTVDYEYYDLNNGAPSWRLDDELLLGLSMCEYGGAACISSGSGLVNSKNCPYPGYMDGSDNCYWEPAPLDRTDDCSAGGCSINNESCLDSEWSCNATTGCCRPC